MVFFNPFAYGLLMTSPLLGCRRIVIEFADNCWYLLVKLVAALSIYYPVRLRFV